MWWGGASWVEEDPLKFWPQCNNTGTRATNAWFLLNIFGSKGLKATKPGMWSL